MKLTPAYQKIAKIKKRVRVIQGGMGAGKTYSILQHWIIQATNNDPEFNGFNSIVSESMPHLRRGAMRDFFAILFEAGIYNPAAHNKTDSLYTINYSVFEFFPADDDSKLRGARRKNLFLNECNNISLHSYNELEPRTQCGVWLDFNPVSAFWAHDLDSSFSERIVLTYLDNPMLSTNERRSIEGRRDNEQWFKVFGRGEIGSVEGIILSNWSIIDQVPEDAELLCTGLDFGFSQDPTVSITLYRYNGELLADQTFYQLGATNRDIANHFKSLERDYGVIYADAAEPKSIAEIRSYGIRIQPAKKGQDSVRAGLTLLQDHKIRPTQSSIELIKSLRNYSWQKDKTGAYMNVPNHAFSDPIDALRYGAVMRLTNSNSKYVII